MRKIDELANERFNGDIQQTISYIMNECEKEEITEYVKEMNTNEAEIAYKIIIDRNFGSRSKEQRSEDVKEYVQLSAIKLTKEEVMQAEVNPFKAKIGKQFLLLLIMQAGIGAISLASNILGIPIENLGLISASLTTFMATSIGPNIVKSIYFNNRKKAYSKEQFLDNNVDLSQNRERSI